MSNLKHTRNADKSREQLIEELRKSEARYRLLFEKAPLGYQSLDENGCFIEVNKTWLDTMGYPLEEVIGKSFADFLHPDWKDHFKENFPRFKAVGEVLGVEFEMVKKDGSLILVSFNGKIGKDEKGIFKQTHCILHDITDQKKAEKAQRQSEKLYRTLGETIPYGIWVADATGFCTYVSQPFLEMVGMTLEQVQQFGWLHLLPPEDVEPTKNHWLHCIQTGENFEREHMFKSKDGTFKNVLAIGRPVRDDEGNIANWVGINLNITERKKSEQAIRELNEKLEHKVAERTAIAEERSQQLQQLALELSNAEDKERKQLALTIHDDLQQDLSALRFNLYSLLPDVLVNEQIEQKMQQYENMINQAIHKCRNLSHDLSPPVLHQSGLFAALEWLANEMEAKHGQQVILKLLPEAEPEAPALASILFRSVRELLFNILKHSGTKTAFIGADVENGFIQVSVKDHGNGCDVETVKARASKSPGFGLFNIEERINFLGGQFIIDSILGNGCCVILRVPKEHKKIVNFQTEQLTSTAPVKVKEQKVPDKSDKIRIMLVDDHASMRETMKMFFDRIEGFDVVAQAANGLEAVQMAKQFNPDVILMDVSMPKMDGIEATSIIKNDQPNIRIIGLSMHDDEKTKERMLSASASAYISKVTPVKEIVELIRKSR